MSAVSTRLIKINRAPVMTLWGAVVAKRLGYSWEEALTLGQAVSVLNARSKGKRLGIIEEKPAEERVLEKKRKPEVTAEEKQVKVLGRPVTVRQTDQGLRAMIGAEVVNPAQVSRYLHSKFGESYEEARQAMEQVAKAYPPKELEQTAYSLYEQFRPKVAAGQRGWGQRGELDLEMIRSMADKE